LLERYVKHKAAPVTNRRVVADNLNSPPILSPWTCRSAEFSEHLRSVLPFKCLRPHGEFRTCCKQLLSQLCAQSFLVFRYH